MEISLLITVIGALLGVVGAAIGLLAGLRRCKSAREKKVLFMYAFASVLVVCACLYMSLFGGPLLKVISTVVVLGFIFCSVYVVRKLAITS